MRTNLCKTGYRIFRCLIGETRDKPNHKLNDPFMIVVKERHIRLRFLQWNEGPTPGCKLCVDLSILKKVHAKDCMLLQKKFDIFETESGHPEERSTAKFGRAKAAI